MSLHIKRQEVIELSWNLKDILEESSFEVDKQGIFPKENIDLLKSKGFMLIPIPRVYGGKGHKLKTISEIIQILASGCLSTSIILGMHYQQVITIMDHADPSMRDRILKEICKENFYIASVTSEYGKGGHLLTSQSSIVWKNQKEF